MSTRGAILVRHAHADWPAWTGRDFDRPLTPEGERGAITTAAAIRDAGHHPVLLLASPALRTRRTAAAIRDTFGLAPGAVRCLDELYDASATQLERALRRQQADGEVVLVAHNPGISELARRLGGQPAHGGFRPGDWLSVDWPAA